MRVVALVLLLSLPTHLIASNAGWWARVKQVEVVAAKLDWGRRALLGTAVVLMCGTLACDLGVVDDLVLDLKDNGDLAVRVGLNYDSSISPNARSGAELAVAQINATGGIRGFLQLKLLARDSRGDSGQSYRLTDELITEQMVHAFVGPSAHALLVSEIAHKHKVPMVTTLATNPNITETGNYIFMAAFTDDFQGQVMADFARDELKARTAAVLLQLRNAYSRVLSQAFVENFEAAGGKVVIQENYRAGNTDFSKQLQAVRGKAPDVVFVPGFVPEVALVVKQGKKLGINAVFIGADGWGGAGLIAAGGNALEGAYFLDHFSAVGLSGALHADASRFIADYTAMYGELPTVRAALGYDAVRVVAQAIGRAVENSGSVDGAVLRDEIDATRNYSGATRIASFNNERQPTKPAVVQTIKNGRIVFHQQITPD